MEIDIEELYRDFPYEIGNELKFIEILDRGAFGTVLHVLDKKTNEEIAVKVIDKIGNNFGYIEKMKQEISILKKLDHPNIVKFYGFMETNNQILIKMEFIKYGNLKHWIKNKENISEEEASIIISRILSAVKYLHNKQICHRDIKPENIMISKKNDLNSIKIIDFGLSNQNFKNLVNNDYSGTYIYMAPELIEKKLYFISIDIWSIGILMFILLNKGKHPFYIRGDNNKEIAEKIKKGKIKFYENISPMAKHLILKLLEPNPCWRYTASQALKHPWITRNFNDSPPKTINDIIESSNKILKDFLYTSIFLNFFKKKENYELLNITKSTQKNNNNIPKEENIFGSLNEFSLFDSKFVRKYSSVISRNRKFINLKTKLLPIKSTYKKSKTKNIKNILDLINNFQNKNLNDSYNYIRKISNPLKDSKNIFSKNTNNINVNAKRYTANIKKTVNVNKIKKKKIKNTDTIKVDEISKEKYNEYSINKRYSYPFPKGEYIYRYLSDKKLKQNLPNIKKPLKRNLFSSNGNMTLNNIEKSNFLSLLLQNKEAKDKRNARFNLLKVCSVKKLRILNK